MKQLFRFERQFITDLKVQMIKHNDLESLIRSNLQRRGEQIKVISTRKSKLINRAERAREREILIIPPIQNLMASIKFDVFFLFLGVRLVHYDVSGRVKLSCFEDQVLDVSEFLADVDANGSGDEKVQGIGDGDGQGEVDPEE